MTQTPESLHCMRCGSVLIRSAFDGERERDICPACGWVYYAHLKVGAGTVVEKDGKLLLVRRDHNPWKGCWCLPAGYLEMDEGPRAGAERETYEETGLIVQAGELLEIYYIDDDPRGNGLLILYAADILSGELRGSPEGREVAFFCPQDLPAQLAGGAHDRVILAWRETRMGIHAHPEG